MGTSDRHIFNPAGSGAQELEAVTVGREAVLEEILSELEARRDAPNNQHFLVTGGWGLGKTHLLCLIRSRVHGSDSLSEAYLPVQTQEEEYSVASLKDLFTRILELAAEQAPPEVEGDGGAAGAGTETEAETGAAAKAGAAAETGAKAKAFASAEQAIAALKRRCRSTGRKVLLLFDRMDLVLGSQMNEDSEIGRLRDLLMNDDFLVVVGTAQDAFREVSGYDRPFYNFFRSVELADLDSGQVLELLEKRAAWEKEKPLQERLQKQKALSRIVHHLLGGNPRTILMLYEVIKAEVPPDAERAVLVLLDRLTPYYRSRMEGLSHQQRKVIDTFARMGRPATPTELAALCSLPVNQINSLLKRLRELGFASVGPQQRRKTTLYLVSGKGFRLWYLLRYAPGGRKELRGLVAYVRILFTVPRWGKAVRQVKGRFRDLFHCALAIEEENSGQARTLFNAALEEMAGAGERQLMEALVSFFLRVSSGERIPILAELLRTLEEGAKEIPGMAAVLPVLAPFGAAFRYWEEGENPEVLDRLNPEVRTLVEGILSKREDAAI